MKIQYKEWRLSENSATLVSQADDIINEYQADGYILTLRQLYYQFVARDFIPNTERSYKNLGNAITNARMAGLISWTAIEDRNRSHNSFEFDEEESRALRALPYYIKFDQWDRQGYYVEVWVEKEALGNVVERACDPLLVPYMACKGYLSASEAWRAGMRFKARLEEGKECVLIHLGDHDPSGIDMTRDNRERLGIFTENLGVEVRRIALNMDQVDEYSPPPNPTKLSDSRAAEYISMYGHTSWELDALEPKIIENLIESEIKPLIDEDKWDEVEVLEEKKRNILRNVYKKWDKILPIVS